MKKRVAGLVNRKSPKRDFIYQTICTSLDRDFYMRAYPDVLASGADPVRHYIEHGHDEGRDPSPDFSTTAYLAHNPDVAKTGVNAFFHYIRHGRSENRVAKHEAISVEAELTKVVPIAAQSQAGEATIEVGACGAVHDSEQDYLYRTVSKFLDSEFYLKTYPDVRVSGFDPAAHYIQHGHDERRDPSPSFSTSGYLARYPDVTAAGVNAFFHFIRHGQFENRTGSTAASSAQRDGKDPALTQVDVTTSTASIVAPFFDQLLDIDFAKASRLLGVNAMNIAPRPWRVMTTNILRPAEEQEVGQTPVPEVDQMMSDGRALADEMIAAARGKTLSLDLWDTVFRRHCAPDAIKLRHARVQWLTRVDLDGPGAQLHPVDLFQLRRIAEADAANDHFEYKISDVAERLATVFAQPGEDFVGSFGSQEMAIERSAISVDEVTGHLIAEHPGRKIIVSDFYMPGRALTDLLRDAGVRGIDAVYSSSDHMATKRAGDLYQLVLDKEGLRPDEVLHIGDRFSADVASARKHGMAALHYLSPSHQPRLERLERAFWAHVGGDASAYAKALADEMGHASGESAGLEMLSVAATGFVLHVLEQALRRKVDKIFFFTREGEFFRRIYQVLVQLDVFDLGAYPEPVVLEVSRRATFAASLEDFTTSELMRLWSQYSSQSVKALATTLNIDLQLWAQIAIQLGLDPEETVDRPWEDPRFVAFVKHPRVAHVARESIWAQRAALWDYLQASGFAPHDDTQRVIVDIGWRGTIQDNLACIVPGKLHGCYFGLQPFLNMQSPKVSKSGYVFDANRGYPLAVPEVAGLEFLFNSCGGSTTGYQNAKAIREIIPDEETIVTGPVAEMQDRLLRACEAVGNFVRAHGLISDDIVSFAREIVSEFAKSPPPEVAEAFFQLSHNESFGVGGVDSMRFDARRLGNLAKLDGSRLHGEISARLKGLRWSAAALQLQAYRNLEQRLTPSQKLHLPSAPAVVRASSLGRNRVAVLSPTPIRGSGGHRTIFNFAAALSRHGYDVHLMHEQPADRATDEWIGSILGGASLTQHSNWVNYLHPAASVATIWYSAEFAAKFWTDAKNFYFVQDYEAMFNPMGDAYLRAGRSYCAGARHICVGRWLAHNLRTQFGVGAAWGGLGVDHEVYRLLPDVERNKKQIALLFQPEKFRRAPELCIAALALVMKKMPDVGIVLYGSDQRPSLPFEHEHRGLITDVNEINRLYNESAAGLCISATNPSRIPFEMMAAGCVPVDVYRYNNLFDYDGGTGVLAHESPESIAEALLLLLADPASRERRSVKGVESVRSRSLGWEMDVAVNAVGMGMADFNFDELERVQPTYTDAPIVSEVWNTDPVNCFLAHQWSQALAGSRPAVVHSASAEDLRHLFLEDEALQSMLGNDTHDRVRSAAK